jgi:Myb-like DNA-binding domain
MQAKTVQLRSNQKKMLIKMGTQKMLDEEHSKFLEALQLFGKNWNKVHKHVGTRSSA